MSRSTVADTSLNKLLSSVSKEYCCDICGESYRTHREAVQCADKCLTKREENNMEIQKVEA